jgi:UDPglucose 6-dehydrogenase
MHIPLINEIEITNNKQKLKIIDKMNDHYGQTLKKDTVNYKDYKFAVWGLAFKPGTDDMREAPSIPIIKKLISLGAKIHAYDPVAEESSKIHFADTITYSEDPYSILKDADALLILTEWPIFQEPDFKEIKKNLKTPLIFDGRNIFSPDVMKELDFTYYGIGIQQN